MIPSRDRVGQIRSYSRWLQNRLGTTVRGMWVPERVWEQAFARDLVDAGIEYTILDDFHFKMAGLTDSQLQGYLITEDEGRVLNVFPGSERLRYTIPFASPEETIGHLAWLSRAAARARSAFSATTARSSAPGRRPRSTYTRTAGSCRFFDALVANQGWIQVTTPVRGDRQRAAGGQGLSARLQLPRDDRVGLADRAVGRVRADLARDAGRRPAGRRCGGSWAAASGGTSRSKYPEADEMYSRMMMVSRRLQEAVDDGAPARRSRRPARSFTAAQCNCGHWHGAFGGIYLPHLRNAVYRSLIAADKMLDRAAGRPETWVEATADDYNFDARQEVRLANDRLMALVLPSRGGILAELDVRRIQHNLLATLTRQPEAYHRKVLAGANRQNGNCASIHDRVVFKQADLDQRIQYDKLPAEEPAGPVLRQRHDAGRRGRRARRPCGAISPHAVYEARIRRNPDRIQVQLVREGMACGAAGADHQGPDARRRQRHAGDRLPAGEPAAGPAAALRRGDEFRRPARRRRRPLLPRPRRQPPGPARHAARPGRVPGPGALRRVAGHRRAAEDLAAHALLDLPHRDGQPDRRAASSWSTNRRPCSRTGSSRPDRDGRWTVTMQLALDTSRAESRVAPRLAAAAVTG